MPCSPPSSKCCPRRSRCQASICACNVSRFSAAHGSSARGRRVAVKAGPEFFRRDAGPRQRFLVHEIMEDPRHQKASDRNAIRHPFHPSIAISTIGIARHFDNRSPSAVPRRASLRSAARENPPAAHRRPSRAVRPLHHRHVGAGRDLGDAADIAGGDDVGRRRRRCSAPCGRAARPAISGCRML